MPTVVTAADGDTLCGLAIAAGFLNCQPLRDLAQNSALLTRPLRAGDLVTIPDVEVKEVDKNTDVEHIFEKENAPPFSIRLVHGSPDKHYLEDDATTVLNVSSFVTNRGGKNNDAAFPSAFEFQQAGHDDPDTFKVEVVDPQAGGSVEVEVEPLQPVYNPPGTLAGHKPFAGATHDDRRLKTDCKKVRSGVAYRSRYLRLVVDDTDRDAVPKQTVLTTDFAGVPEVEILDQDIKATYIRQTCPAPADNKCRVSVTVPLDRGSAVDLAIHVLRGTPTGVVETTKGGPGDNGITKLEDSEIRVQTFCRQFWAQAQIKFRIKRPETVDLPSNMITVADATANVAQGTSTAGGPGQVGFTVQVQRFGGAANVTQAVGPIIVPPASTPEQTANLIRDAINAIAGLTARVSMNPPEVGLVAGAADAALTTGSADVLITDSSGGRVTITNLTPNAQQDRSQKVAVADVTLNVHIRNGFNNYHVGHPEQRNLFKALDTSDTVIDVIVVTSIPGTTLNGFTVCENKQLNANRQPMTGVKNTVMIDRGSADDQMSSVFILPHEIGHVLTDDALHADSNRQLMFPTMQSLDAKVTDTKRLFGINPVATNWDQMRQNANGSVGSQRFHMNVRQRVRDTSGALLS